MSNISEFLKLNILVQFHHILPKEFVDECKKVLKALKYTFEGEILSKIDKKAKKLKVLKADSNITLMIICQKIFKL